MNTEQTSENIFMHKAVSIIQFKINSKQQADVPYNYRK